MKSKRMLPLFAVMTLSLFWIFAPDGFAQRAGRASQKQPCDPNKWVEQVVKVGVTSPYADILKASVLIEITDENGKRSSTGNYLHVTNYGDQPIEWVRYGNSPFSPVDGGAEDSLFLATYRSKNDRTPTQETIVLRYKCNSIAGDKPKGDGKDDQDSTSQTQPDNQPQSQKTTVQSPSDNSSNASKNLKTLANAIVGCWRSFPNGGNDTQLQMDNQYTSEGTVIAMNSKAGGVVRPPEDYIKAQKLTYTVRGNKVVVTNVSINYTMTYEYDGDRLYALDLEGVRQNDFMIKITCGEPFQ